MWQCAECRNVQSESCYCTACYSTALISLEVDMHPPRYGKKVYYRSSEFAHAECYISLGEFDKRGWLKVAAVDNPDKFWGYLHRWETE